MKKKIFAAILATVMVMGLSINAFAEANITSLETAGAGKEVTVTSSVTTPTISVTVPTSTAIIINPFQLKVTKDGKDYYDQIVSVPQEITSASNVKLAVNVSELKATPTAGVAISTKSAKTLTAKSAYLYLAIAPDLSASGATPVQVVATTTGAKKDAALILAEGDTTAQKCEFKICGDVNANPTKTENKVTTADPWATGDTVAISIKFTFTPQIATAPSTP